MTPVSAHCRSSKTRTVGALAANPWKKMRTAESSSDRPPEGAEPTPSTACSLGLTQSASSASRNSSKAESRAAITVSSSSVSRIPARRWIISLIAQKATPSP